MPVRNGVAATSVPDHVLWKAFRNSLQGDSGKLWSYGLEKPSRAISRDLMVTLEIDQKTRNADRNVDSEDLVQEVSFRNKDFTGTTSVFFTLAKRKKKLSMFFLSGSGRLQLSAADILIW